MTATDWDAWFAFLAKDSPVSEQQKPMAEHECRECGQFNCDCKTQQIEVAA